MGKSKKAEKKSKKKHKHSKHKSKKHKKAKRQSAEPNKQPDEKVEPYDEKNEETFAIPLDLMNSKSHAPETPEEYQKRQSQIRRVKDPVTGRVRLIKGDGEVLEEIVSRSRHEEINKSATQADGCYFEKNTVGTKK